MGDKGDIPDSTNRAALLGKVAQNGVKAIAEREKKEEKKREKECSTIAQFKGSCGLTFVQSQVPRGGQLHPVPTPPAQKNTGK